MNKIIVNQIASQNLNTETYIQTPIGKLRFYSTTSDGSVEEINILQCDVGQLLPERMRVPTTIAVLLHFSVMKPIKEFNFCCKWENLKTSGYGSSGEGLDAWEWQHEDCIVIIGREDPVYLNHRIPSVPAELFEPSYYPTTMEENEIRICLKELPVGKSYSLHYVISWNDFPEPEGSFCWLNVDLPHKLVRKLLTKLLVDNSSL